MLKIQSFRKNVNMHILHTKLIFAFLAVIMCTVGLFAGDFVEGKFIAKFKPDISIKSHQEVTSTGNSTLDSLNKNFHCSGFSPLSTQDANSPLYGVYTFKFDKTIPVEKLIAVYMASGLFLYVEPDYINQGNSIEQALTLPNDQYFFRQWALHNDATYTMNGLYTPKEDADIDMPEAWEIEKGDSSVIIAILDSGCKMDHPELAGRIWRNEAEIPGNGIDDDNNGFIDDVNGWDFINNDNDPTDDHGHGTAIAGTIGANYNNEIGFAGVNPNAKIMVIKVLDSLKSGNTELAVRGIEYAIKMKAKILNFSLGGTKFIQTENDIIQHAVNNKIIVVAGTGNNNSEQILYPAAFENVITVGATSPNDNRYISADTKDGSNYGNEIDIVAPGAYIVCLDKSDNNKYTKYGLGTSLSTALVTGVVSLLLSKNPDLTPAQVLEILQKSADDQVGDPSEDTQGWDKYYGWGRLNAHKALQLASSVKKINNRLVKQVIDNQKILMVNGGLFLTNTRNFALNGTMLLNKNGSKTGVAAGVYVKEKLQITNYGNYKLKK
jgi:subtilisin family serine protease